MTAQLETISTYQAFCPDCCTGVGPMPERDEVEDWVDQHNREQHPTPSNPEADCICGHALIDHGDETGGKCWHGINEWSVCPCQNYTPNPSSPEADGSGWKVGDTATATPVEGGWIYTPTPSPAADTAPTHQAPTVDDPPPLEPTASDPSPTGATPIPTPHRHCSIGCLRTDEHTAPQQCMVIRFQ